MYDSFPHLTPPPIPVVLSSVEQCGALAEATRTEPLISHRSGSWNPRDSARESSPLTTSPVEMDPILPYVRWRHDGDAEGVMSESSPQRFRPMPASAGLGSGNASFLYPLSSFPFFLWLRVAQRTGRFSAFSDGSSILLHKRHLDPAHSTMA